jgi:hypothetical protein
MREQGDSIHALLIGLQSEKGAVPTGVRINWWKERKELAELEARREASKPQVVNVKIERKGRVLVMIRRTIRGL